MRNISGLKGAFAKIVVVFLMLGITAGGTWKVSYDRGYDEGYVLGDDVGYVSGYDVGWDLGNFEGFEEGYDKGEIVGYISGHTAGEYTGRQEGYASGYAVGRDAGWNSGWNEGRYDGLSEGKVIGFEDGYDDGVEVGYDEGVEVGYVEGVMDGAGHGYNLRDPTYREARMFMSSDRTDSNKYIDDVYACRHFAKDFIENAMAQGYQCHYVSITFPEGAHAMVAFNTVDRGMLYISPQTDEIFKPRIGKVLYDRDDYKAPSWDDTIVEILVIP